MSHTLSLPFTAMHYAAVNLQNVDISHHVSNANNESHNTRVHILVSPCFFPSNTKFNTIRLQATQLQ